MFIFGWPLLAVIAVLVRVSSPGPILFAQERLGRHAKPFVMWKFRTMRVRAPSTQSNVWTADDEAAITRVGRILRNYGLDELPQTFNILRGDMSVLGWRPGLPSQIDLFGGRHDRIFTMRPGVLSLAGVKGRRGIPMAERIVLHRAYVDRWSLRLDLEILCRALFVVLRCENSTEVTTLP